MNWKNLKVRSTSVVEVLILAHVHCVPSEELGFRLKVMDNQFLMMMCNMMRNLRNHSLFRKLRLTLLKPNP